MGPRGSNVQKITTDFNVQIKFPDKAKAGERPQANGEVNGEHVVSACDIIRISGKKENCAGASKALKALVPINIKVRFFLLISRKNNRQKCKIQDECIFPVETP